MIEPALDRPTQDISLIAQFSGMRADVAYWPMSEVAARLVDFRSMGHCGLDLLKMSFSHFDPYRKSASRKFALDRV